MTKKGKFQLTKKTDFFGFSVKDDPQLYGDFVKLDNDVFMLHTLDGEIIEINWIQHFSKQSSFTENEIWEYLLHECQKYTRAKKIFIDRLFVELKYKPLTNYYLDLIEKKLKQA